MLAYRFMLSPQVQSGLFESPALRHALEQRLIELSSGMPLVNKRWLPHDPLGLAPDLMAHWQGNTQPQRRHGVWFDATGEKALLLAHVRVAGLDLDRQEALIQRIQAQFETLTPDGNLRLQMTGPAVFAVKSREIIRQESAVLSAAASIAGLLVLLAAYRSWRVALLSAIPVASGMIAGLCLASLMTGPIHGIALAFAIVLVGVTLDYPLHFFSHVRSHATLSGSASSIGPALFISAITTALAFCVLTTSDFHGLAQLGIMTSTGVIVAALVTRWVMPATWVGDIHPNMNWAHGMAILIRPKGNHGKFAAAAFIIVTLLAALYVHSRTVVWEEDLASLSPIPSEDRQLDQQLRRGMGAPDVRHLILIDGPDQESVLRQSEHISVTLDGLIQQKMLHGYDLAARYLPSLSTQRLRQQALPTPEPLQEQLSKALNGLPFRSDYFTPFVNDVEQARTLPTLTRAMLEDTPLGIKVDALLRHSDAHWTALVVLNGVENPTALMRALKGTLPDTAQLMDLKASTNDMVSRFRVEALDNSLLIGGMILLVLLIWLRSPIRLMRALLPVLASLALTIAVLLAMGEKLNLFHLIAMLLVLGLAVDYTVFLQAHATHHDERSATAHALIACVTSTTAVFVLLAISSIPVLHSIGITVALGVPIAVSAGIIMHRYGKPISSTNHVALKEA